MRAGSVALVALLAALVVATAIVSPGRAPEPGRETTLWLAIESRAHDRDLKLEGTDRDRFRARFGREPQLVALTTEGAERRLDAPWLWTVTAAAARRIGGPSGPFLLQGVLFALAAALALATIRPRLGPVSAPLLAGVALAGSAAFAVPFRLEPHALELAAASLAAAAVWRRGFGRAAPPEDVYQGEATGTPGLARWLVAGLATGVVLAGSAAYLPLVVPLVAGAPERRRWLARGALLGGAVASVAAIVALGGAPWAPADLVVSPKLWGWSAIGLLAGRGVGLLPYYLPATLLFATAGRDEGRRFVVPATLAAILVQLALAPFDFVENGGGFGNGWFLPLYAVLLAAASHDEGPRWTLAIGAAGAPFLLAPVWLASAGLLAPAAAVDRLVSPAVALLPEPTTLRAAPGAADLVRPGLVARGIEPAIFAGRGRLRLFARRGRLFVVADRALSSLRLELGADAPVAIEVRGGKLGNTTIRPDGELAVDVALDPRRARRHPVWWSREDAWIHALEVRLPAVPAAPIALDVPFGRGVVPAVNERR